MVQKIWFNGQLVDSEKAQVHILSHALHYGTSVFEGIRCYKTPNGPAIFRLQEHIERLFNSAKIYRFPINYSAKELSQACIDAVKENNLDNAYIRPIAFIGNVGLGLNPPKGYSTDVAVIAFSWGTYLGEDALENGIDAMISSWQRVAPNTIPSTAKAGGNYLSSLLIGSEARRLGYQEGIALDTKGYVSEGAGENIFVIQNNILYTPPSTASALPGITRDSVIQLAKRHGIQCEEKKLNREQLYLADEIFMTGTAAEITPVRSIDDIAIGNGTRGDITKQIQDYFFGLFSHATKDESNWLTYL